MIQAPKHVGDTVSSLEEWLQEHTPLRYFSDEHLLHVTETVPDNMFGTQELSEIAEELVDTHRMIREGVGGCTGLALNQIGGKYSMATVWTRGMESPLVMCNPTVIYAIGRAAFQESCMSGIGNTGMVVRPEIVTLGYRDIAGSESTARGDASDNGRRFSRVAQHEIDHLNGIICTQLFEPNTELQVHALAQFAKEPFSRGIVSLPA